MILAQMQSGISCSLVVLFCFAYPAKFSIPEKRFYVKEQITIECQNVSGRPLSFLQDNFSEKKMNEKRRENEKMRFFQKKPGRLQ